MKSRVRAWWASRRTRHVQVEGVDLVVPPGVLDPVLFRAGAWFAAQVADQVASMGGAPRVLDLGCGTGVVGVLADRAGARVVASDIDAVACAAARENGLGDVRRGDLFEPVPGEVFDLVCFNPPFFQGRAAGKRLGRALYGGEDLDVIRRFSASVAQHLAPGGRAWVVLSERAPGSAGALGVGWRPHQSGAVAGEQLGIWVMGPA